MGFLFFGGGIVDLILLSKLYSSTGAGGLVPYLNRNQVWMPER